MVVVKMNIQKYLDLPYSCDMVQLRLSEMDSLACFFA